jgi:uncharacterized protein YkwD
MRSYILIFALAFLTAILSGQEKDQSVFEYYKQLNENEPGLSEFKDSDEALMLKIRQLDVINNSRKKYRLQPVKLDILASRVANKMCREAAENEYTSHWNLAGEKPYHRYAFAGGYDHVSENAFAEWTDGSYEISSALISSKMKTGHEGFMREKAPYDGHKKNIIDPLHNWVGIGYHITSQQFRYYEEFINRYLTFGIIPSVLRPGEPGRINVDTKGNGYLFFMTIYREDFPVPMKVSQLKKTGGYDDFSRETYRTVPGWDLSKYRNGTSYSIPLNFQKEGLYYIHIYTDKKEVTGSGGITTKGRSPVSGIVIRVKN